MHLNIYSDNIIIKLSFYFLVIFILFDYIFSLTIFSSQMIIYFMMIFNMISFIICAIKYGCDTNPIAKMWTLYLCLHMFSLFFNGNISTIPYWIISLLLLYISPQIVCIFKPKIFIFIGLFFSCGVFFQYLFPSLYNSYVFPLFIGRASEFIESSVINEYGFSGFSPQTGTTAFILLICQSVLLSFKNYDGLLNYKLTRYCILILFVLAVLLTGKRMLSLISIVIILTSIFVSNKRNNFIWNTIIWIILFSICYMVFQYFVENISQYADNVYLKRIVGSFTAYEGDDITSGRNLLYEKAWHLFEQEPFLGIGANNFSKISGMETSVHNTYLQILCEEGILRFLLFIIPILIVFFNTIGEFNRIEYTNDYRIEYTDDCRIEYTDDCSFLKLSLFLQIVFILYSFTGNTIVNNSNFVLYFIGISLFIYTKYFQE